MNVIFHQQIRKTVECYVDDIAVKSRTKGDHITDLKVVFDIMRAHQLKMNPTKSFLGVASGKFLEFVVTSTGIHLDPEKVRAIQEMQPPQKPQGAQGITRTIGVHPQVHIKPFREMPTLRQADEKGCFIHLGRRLSKSI